MKHRFIVWGSGKTRDHLFHTAEKTDRARKVAEYFQAKYRKPDDTERDPAAWAVELDAPCLEGATIYQAEGVIDMRTRYDGAVHGWIRIGFDPETGEEMIWDEATRVI
jgi:hypothetical protein